MQHGSGQVEDRARARHGGGFQRRKCGIGRRIHTGRADAGACPRASAQSARGWRQWSAGGRTGTARAGEADSAPDPPRAISRMQGRAWSVPHEERVDGAPSVAQLLDEKIEAERRDVICHRFEPRVLLLVEDLHMARQDSQASALTVPSRHRPRAGDFLCRATDRAFGADIIQSVAQVPQATKRVPVASGQSTITDATGAPPQQGQTPSATGFSDLVQRRSHPGIEDLHRGGDERCSAMASKGMASPARCRP